MLLLLLGACAAPPVTWDYEPTADLGAARSYQWGEVRGALCNVVAAEAVRTVDRMLEANGWAKSTTPKLLVLMRFEPIATIVNTSGTARQPGALAGVVEFGGGPAPPQYSPTRPGYGAVMESSEAVELELLERESQRVLCAVERPSSFGAAPIPRVKLLSGLA